MKEGMERYRKGKRKEWERNRKGKMEKGKRMMTRKRIGEERIEKGNKD